MTIPYPDSQMDFVEWRDLVRLLRPDLLINPRVDSEDNWKEWADQILMNTLCQTIGSPRHDGYNDWRKWADDFIKSFGQNL